MAAPIVPTPHTMFFPKSEKSEEERRTEELLAETNKRRTEIQNAMVQRQQRLLEYEDYKERMGKEKAEWEKHAAAGTMAGAQEGVEKIERNLAQVDTKIAEHKDRLTRDQDKMNQLEERRQQILKMQQRQQAKQQQQMLQPQTAVGNLGGAAGRRSYKADEAQAELDKIKLQQQKLEQTFVRSSTFQHSGSHSTKFETNRGVLGAPQRPTRCGALGQLGEL